MKKLSVNIMATAALLVGLAACQKQSDGEKKGAAEKAGAQIDAAAAHLYAMGNFDPCQRRQPPACLPSPRGAQRLFGARHDIR